MLQVFRAFDRKPLAEVPVDDAAAMEAKLQTAVSVFKDKARRCSESGICILLSRLPERGQATAGRDCRSEPRYRGSALRRRRIAEFYRPRNSDGTYGGIG
jgi:hypothetical protein